MPFSMKVGLRPGDIVRGDIVLDGDQLPPTESGTAAPAFRPTSIVAKLSPISATV